MTAGFYREEGSVSCRHEYGPCICYEGRTCGECRVLRVLLPFSGSYPSNNSSNDGPATTPFNFSVCTNRLRQFEKPIRTSDSQAKEMYAWIFFFFFFFLSTRPCLGQTGSRHNYDFTQSPLSPPRLFGCFKVLRCLPVFSLAPQPEVLIVPAHQHRN